MKNNIYRATCKYIEYKSSGGFHNCGMDCWHWKRFRNDRPDNKCNDIKLDWLDYLMVKDNVTIIERYYEEET